MNEIKLGDLARDKVSGFEGIVTSVIYHLYGCERVCLDPVKRDKDGKVIAGHYVDREQCELIEADRIKVPDKVIVEKPAGPRRNPPAR